MKRDLHYMDSISADRVRQELVRLLEDKTALQALGLASDLGILAAVHPALDVTADVQYRLSAANEYRLIRRLPLFAALTYGADESLLPGLVSRLNMDSESESVVRDTVFVKGIIPVLALPDIRPSQIHAALYKKHPAAIHGCALATDNVAARDAMKNYLAELRFVEPILKGGDVMALGVPQGPLVGEALNALLTARLDGTVTTREDEKALVQDSLGL